MKSKSVRCVNCRFYPNDCGYWKPHKVANPVWPTTWHGCPDYEPVPADAPAYVEDEVKCAEIEASLNLADIPLTTDYDRRVQRRVR